MSAGARWAEGAEPRELVLPRRRPDSGEDIPTIPDLDDLQEMLDVESLAPSTPAPAPGRGAEACTYAELERSLDGCSGARVGEVGLGALLTHVRAAEPPEPDTVWTVDSLLADLHHVYNHTPPPPHIDALKH